MMCWFVVTVSLTASNIVHRCIATFSDRDRVLSHRATPFGLRDGVD